MCIYTTDRPCLRPYTVNFKCTFKYFPKIERPRALAWQCAGLLSALATVAETAQGFKDARHLHICHSSYGLTINGRLLADLTANHFSMKLSLFMCMLAACSGWPPQCSTFSSSRSVCKNGRKFRLCSSSRASKRENVLASCAGLSGHSVTEAQKLYIHVQTCLL